MNAETTTLEQPHPSPAPRTSLRLDLPRSVIDGDEVDLIDVGDGLSDDLTLLRAVEMGVIGLGDEHDCQQDANAVAELVRCLETRLEERSSHVGALLGQERAVVSAESAEADAELLQAWEDWRAAMKVYIAADDNDPGVDALYNAAAKAEARIRELPAYGPAGLAVKLRVILDDFAYEPGPAKIFKALTYGRRITDAMVGDGASENILSALRSAERMAARTG